MQKQQSFDRSEKVENKRMKKREEESFEQMQGDCDGNIRRGSQGNSKQSERWTSTSRNDKKGESDRAIVFGRFEKDGGL